MPTGHSLVEAQSNPIAHWLSVEQVGGRQTFCGWPKQRLMPVMVGKQQSRLCVPQQQFWVAPPPPQTSPGAWQEFTSSQRRNPSESGAPQDLYSHLPFLHELEQHWLSAEQLPVPVMHSHLPPTQELAQH